MMPEALAVCRFSRLLALTAWRQLARYVEKGPPQYSVMIEAFVLKVLGELATEVEGRLLYCEVKLL